ncbi:RdgB/HAM1 family non-canonical purine NTP pyrophosphatase [Sneathiella aquimaris]|uniref:RdgB/HAM1 family non-canonical purine NTP pyrophosphatase n=1 Tax=Sneathiella aquimaris TaxID=2599305 RepID=UPI00146A2ABC|nr:RdgB/HAM1 family non-canonical purine NTP pyrophosphatase [Sneathiella aquimaris]
MSHRQFSGKKLVVASHNMGKVREIRDLLLEYGVEPISAGELGLPEPIEDGATFIANAEIKSLAAARASGEIALSDDSGFAVEALKGDPGIYSARWAGPTKDFSVAMALVKEKLDETGAFAAGDLKASFFCALSLAWPDGHTETFEGRIDGRFNWPPRGDNGFGYDPVFTPTGHDLTFAEMQPEDKLAINHRADAFRQLIDACFAKA